MNTETGLGVSPIISIAYCVSSILDWNFGNTTLELYCVFDYLFRFQADSFWLNLLILIGAVLLTGLGVVMSVDMRLVPNPGDGIVQTIADRSEKLIGIGIGTLVAMLGVGRAVALFNLLLWRPMTKVAGLKPEHIVKEKEEE